MNIGVVLPNGWTGEYDGWNAQSAWQRTVAVAQQAEHLGFDSIWMYDHFHPQVTVPDPLGGIPEFLSGTTDEITFEAYTALSALAMVTRRVQIGQAVTCNGFRPPALLGKMASTMDMISGGRMILGIGAGWKEDEWRAYGYGYPTTGTRLSMLGESLEILTQMFAPGKARHASFAGEYYTVSGAVNVPKPVREAGIPIMVGGNGPNVTWRLAARYGAELNLDGLTPDEVEQALPVIRQRCEEFDRDPASLPVSCTLGWWDFARSGQERVELFGRYKDLGLVRLMGLLQDSAASDDALESLAADARASGCKLVDE